MSKLQIMTNRLQHGLAALLLIGVAGCGGGGSTGSAANVVANSTTSASETPQTVIMSGFTVVFSSNAVRSVFFEHARNTLQAKIDQALRLAPKLAVLKGNLQFRFTESGQQSTSIGFYGPHVIGESAAGLIVGTESFIEFPSIFNFATGTADNLQPLLVLHEMAHAYHFQVLGTKHSKVLSGFSAAAALGIYNRVERIAYGTNKQTAYAMANELEFFAETTESYFGANDYYPYTRSQLQSFDPASYQLMRDIWGE